MILQLGITHLCTLCSWCTLCTFMYSQSNFWSLNMFLQNFEIFSSGRLCRLPIIKRICFCSVMFCFCDFENWHFLCLKYCDLPLLQFAFVISKSEGRTTVSYRNREVLSIKEQYWSRTHHYIICGRGEDVLNLVNIFYKLQIFDKSRKH